MLLTFGSGMMYWHPRNIGQETQNASSHFPIELLLDRSVQDCILLGKESLNNLEQFAVAVEPEKMTHQYQQRAGIDHILLSIFPGNH